MSFTFSFSKLLSQRSILVNWQPAKMWTRWQRIFKRSSTCLVSRFWNMTSLTSEERRSSMATLSTALTCSSLSKRSQSCFNLREVCQVLDQTSLPLMLPLAMTTNNCPSWKMMMMKVSKTAWRMMRPSSWVTLKAQSASKEEADLIPITTVPPTTSNLSWRKRQRPPSLKMRKSSMRRSWDKSSRCPTTTDRCTITSTTLNLTSTMKTTKSWRSSWCNSSKTNLRYCKRRDSLRITCTILTSAKMMKTMMTERSLWMRKIWKCMNSFLQTISNKSNS